MAGGEKISRGEDCAPRQRFRLKKGMEHRGRKGCMGGGGNYLPGSCLSSAPMSSMTAMSHLVFIFTHPISFSSNRSIRVNSMRFSSPEHKYFFQQKKRPVFEALFSFVPLFLCAVAPAFYISAIISA
jgi:hypothetical protein